MKIINYEHIYDNVEVIQKYNEKKLIAVVKNNAYNCGLKQVVDSLLKANVDMFMLTEPSDAVKLITLYPDLNILISNPLTSEQLNYISNYKFHLIIDSYDYLVENIKYLKNHFLHLQVNSSMNRFGIDSLAELQKITKYAIDYDLELVGLATHFSLEDEDLKLSNNAITFFKSMFLELTKHVKLQYIHAENSFTFLQKYKELNFCNYARVGLLIYGYNNTNKILKLKPAITLKAKITKIRKLNSSDTFSYGLDNSVARDSYIAICDVGYGDGLLRSRSKLPVTIGEKKYNIIGNISMSHTYIKVDEDVVVGEKVIFYDENIKISEHAKLEQIPSSMIMSYLN